MCFPRPPKMPEAPPVPNADAQHARSRRMNERQAAEMQRGTAATILNSPLGDPDYGEDVRRTRLGGI